MSSSPTLDLRSPAVIFVNNLETDGRYKRWPASLISILQPAAPGQLRALRKNLFTLVAVLDPLNQQTPAMVEQILAAVEKPLPVRCGFLFVTAAGQQSIHGAAAKFVPFAEEEQPSAPPTTSADLAIVRAFAVAMRADEQKGFGALKWLHSFYGTVKDLTQLTVEDVKTSFLQRYSQGLWVSQSKVFLSWVLFVACCRAYMKFSVNLLAPLMPP